MSKVTITYNNLTVAEITGQTSPVSVTYGGAQVTTVSDGETKTLNCNGKYMSSTIICAGKVLDCSGKIMNSNVGISCESEGPDYLTFTPSTGTVSVTPSSGWDVTTKEYSIDGGITWNTWDESSAIVGNTVKLRGLEGTCGSCGDAWDITGTEVACSGNIETILDYQVVANGQHPTMADWCYENMFQGCTSLTTAPELPATSLTDECYAAMFQGCTSLTTAPELPATSLYFGFGCYKSMFQGCTSLTTAPSLPATDLGQECYESMFQGCTSLTTMPNLQTTFLMDNCYDYMFKNCTSLYVSDTSGTGYDKAWRIPASGTITSDDISQSNMFTNCLGTRSSDSMAGLWGQSYTYYTQNNPV